MAKKETDKELLILKCAEEEFLDKGYTNAKTTDIAKRAGVTHAMLHYYYRTKENLFEIILEKKTEKLVEMFLFPLKQDIPFTDKLKKGIEGHFDFIAANPKLPNFIFNEILNNDANRKRFLKLLQPKVENLANAIDADMKEESSKGNIKYIKVIDLLYTIISVNIFVFLASPVIKGMMSLNDKQFEEFKKHRKQENVELIMNLLKV